MGDRGQGDRPGADEPYSTTADRLNKGAEPEEPNRHEQSGIAKPLHRADHWGDVWRIGHGNRRPSGSPDREQDRARDGVRVDRDHPPGDNVGAVREIRRERDLHIRAGSIHLQGRPEARCGRTTGNCLAR